MSLNESKKEWYELILKFLDSNPDKNVHFEIRERGECIIDFVFEIEKL